jgi:hypothetical protein
MSVASPVMMRVPMMAWRPPPPSPTTLRIERLKKSMSRRPAPSVMTV